MMQYKLTENEAKMLRGINDYGKAGFHDVVAIARLTPDEARIAALHLAEMRLIFYDEGSPVIALTKDGEAVRRTLLKSTYKSTHQSSGPPVEIVSSEAEAMAESPFESMSEEQLDDAFAEELAKYSDESENSGG